MGRIPAKTNLAIALRSMGEEVRILDADVGLGDVDILPRLAPRHNIAHVPGDGKSLKDVTVDGPLQFFLANLSSAAAEVR